MIATLPVVFRGMGETITAATVANTEQSGSCPTCEHPSQGVRVFRRKVICAHGETDNGIGDVQFCNCRADNHALDVVRGRVID